MSTRLDWRRARKERPDTAPSQARLLEVRADRYLAAVDAKPTKKQRKGKGKR